MDKPRRNLMSQGDRMRALLSAGIISLILAYTLSQFYRAFLAVLTPVLQAELGAGPDDLAISSGLWFFAIRAMICPSVTAWKSCTSTAAT